MVAGCGMPWGGRGVQCWTPCSFTLRPLRPLSLLRLLTALLFSLCAFCPHFCNWAVLTFLKPFIQTSFIYLPPKKGMLESMYFLWNWFIRSVTYPFNCVVFLLNPPPPISLQSCIVFVWPASNPIYFSFKSLFSVSYFAEVLKKFFPGMHKLRYSRQLSR